jgi:hypothetical protein
MRKAAFAFLAALAPLASAMAETDRNGVEAALGLPAAAQPDGVRRFDFARTELTVQAGGVATRLGDGNTYHMLRANAAEDNVRLYHVTGGRRVQFAGQERLPIAMGAWHTLGLRLEGDRFMAWLDEEPLFEARDTRIADAGGVALWLIADSQTVFEAPRIEVLR